MSIIRYLLRILRAILATPEPESPKVEPLTLAARTAHRVVAVVGEETPIKAVVFRGSPLRPAAGVRVRYTVLDGAANLADRSEFVAKTGSDGVAQALVRMQSDGAALIGIALDGGGPIAATFRVQTRGTVYALELRAEPSVQADPGHVRVRIAALDFRKQPVTGATLFLQATLGAHGPTIVGEVMESGYGNYEGTVQTHLAGEWQVLVQDRMTGVTAATCVHVLPGPADRFELGNTQPRSAEPRGELPLEVALLDKFGNRIDPARIAFDSPVPGWTRLLRADTARFTIRYPGIGVVPIRLRDTQSHLTLAQDITFDAVAMQDPGLVLVGSRYRVPVYLFLPIDRAVSEARIDITFDAELVQYAGTERITTGLALTVESTLAHPGLLSIAVASQEPLHAQDFPNGIYICDIDWDCIGEGDTCFDAVAVMSPAHPGVAMCVVQKRREPKTICVNIITMPNMPGSRAAGDIAADSIENVFNSDTNVGRCCPAVTVERHYCELPFPDMVKVYLATGDGAISSEAEFEAIDRMGVGCRMENCLNMWMLPIRAWGALGRNSETQKMVVIDPAAHTTDPNTGAHEFGHALGLDHMYNLAFSEENVMNPIAPVGTELLQRPDPRFMQCTKVWENIDGFGG